MRKTRKIKRQKFLYKKKKKYLYSYASILPSALKMVTIDPLNRKSMQPWKIYPHGQMTRIYKASGKKKKNKNMRECIVIKLCSPLNRICMRTRWHKISVRWRKRVWVRPRKWVVNPDLSPRHRGFLDRCPGRPSIYSKHYMPAFLLAPAVQISGVTPGIATHSSPHLPLYSNTLNLSRKHSSKIYANI